MPQSSWKTIFEIEHQPRPISSSKFSFQFAVPFLSTLCALLANHKMPGNVLWPRPEASSSTLCRNHSCRFSEQRPIPLQSCFPDKYRTSECRLRASSFISFNVVDLKFVTFPRGGSCCCDAPLSSCCHPNTNFRSRVSLENYSRFVTLSPERRTKTW